MDLQQSYQQGFNEFQVDQDEELQPDKRSNRQNFSNIACTYKGRSADIGCFSRQNEGIKITQHQHQQNNGSKDFTTDCTESDSRWTDSAELLSAKQKLSRQQSHPSITRNSAKTNTWQSLSEKLHIPQIDGNDDGSDIQDPERDHKTLDTNSPVAASQTLPNSSNQNMTEGGLKTKSVGQSSQDKASQAIALENTQAEPINEVPGASQSLQRSQKGTRRAKKKKSSRKQGTAQKSPPDIKSGVKGRFGPLSVQVSPGSRRLETSRNEENAGGEFKIHSVISIGVLLFLQQ